MQQNMYGVLHLRFLFCFVFGFCILLRNLCSFLKTFSFWNASVFFFFKVVAFINICKIVFDEKKNVYSNDCSLLLGLNTIDINNQIWGFFLQISANYLYGHYTIVNNDGFNAKLRYVLRKGTQCLPQF